jgi:replicative DNA helicase
VFNVNLGVTRIPQLPPQNLEAEECTLGGMLLDNSMIDETMSIVRPEDFYRDSHQVVCRRVYELWSKGKPVDAITLIECLKAHDEFDDIGGDSTITRILEAPPHAANTVYYAEIVKQKAISRDVIETAYEMIRSAHSNNFSADELVTKCEEAIFAVSESRTQDDTLDLADGVDECNRSMAQRLEGAFVGIASPWREIDDHLDGFQDGTLTIVAGRPSMGKSAFAHNLLDHVAVNQGVTPFLVSLETNSKGVAARMKQARAQVDSYRIKKPWLLNDDERWRLRAASECLRENTFPIADRSGLTISQVCAAARRQKARRGIGLIVVDYLQLIEGETPGEPRHEAVARISRRLKQLAGDLSVPVVALSQLNRAVEGREDHRPRMADLRESGAIEQDADAILLVHRPEYYNPDDQPGVAEIIIAKNRDGATGTVKLVFLRHYARFDTLAAIDPHQAAAF